MALNYKKVLDENWADIVDDEEEQRGAPLPNVSKFFTQAPAPVNESAFPTLADAVKAPPKSKNKKGVKMSLHELQAAPAGTFKSSSKDDVKDILAQLPKSSSGVKDDSREARLGGAFGGRGDFARGGRGGDDDRRPPREDAGPSRADMTEDWGSTRKFAPGSGGGAGGFGGGGNRDSGFSREPRAASAADAVESWGRRGPEATSAHGRSDDRRGFGEGPDRPLSGPSRADTEDQWSRGRSLAVESGPRAPRAVSREGPSNADMEDKWVRKAAAPLDPPQSSRPAPSVADAEEKWVRRTPAAEPSTSQPPARPRLQLAPRTLPLQSAPESSSSTSGASKSNPFGAARPREEVLKEKGVEPSAEASAEAVTSDASAADVKEGLESVCVVENGKEAKARW